MSLSRLGFSELETVRQSSELPAASSVFSTDTALSRLGQEDREAVSEALPVLEAVANSAMGCAVPNGPQASVAIVPILLVTRHIQSCRIRVMGPRCRFNTSTVASIHRMGPGNTRDPVWKRGAVIRRRHASSDGTVIRAA